MVLVLVLQLDMDSHMDASFDVDVNVSRARWIDFCWFDELLLQQTDRFARGAN